MSSLVKKQDMPPKGGYKAIPYKRNPCRTLMSGYTMIGAYLGITAGSAYLYYLNYLAVHKERLELRSAEFAIRPLLLAERDREYLKQLRRNRDEEKELMADVEGWKVGTWYGEPVFKTPQETDLVTPMYQEYFNHCSYWDYARRLYLAFRS